MKEQFNLSIHSDLRIGQALVGFIIWIQDKYKCDVFYIDDDVFYGYYREWLDYIENEEKVKKDSKKRSGSLVKD